MAVFPKFRRAFVWLHLVVGLAAALYAIVIGVTGSLLVYREELEAWQHPEVHTGAVPASTASTQQILEGIRQRYPGWRALSMTAPHEGTPYWMTYLLRGRDAKQVYSDPASGREAAAFAPKEGWVGELADLHVSLLLGRGGSRWNGYGAASLLVLCFSGIILWMPATLTRWWQQARGKLRLELRGPARRFFWQAHHALGIASVSFIILLSFTGTYFAWSQTYVKTVNRYFARSKEPTSVKHQATEKVLPLETLAARAQQEFPGLPLYRIAIADVPTQVARITLRNGRPAEFHNVSAVVLDPVTGAVLNTTPLAERPWGDLILTWFSVLHMGVFGGWLVRILWFVMGLSFPALAISGVAMWWLRVVKPLRQGERTKKQSPAPVEVSA